MQRISGRSEVVDDPKGRFLSFNKGLEVPSRDRRHESRRLFVPFDERSFFLPLFGTVTRDLKRIYDWGAETQFTHKIAGQNRARMPFERERASDALGNRHNQVGRE